MKRTLCLSLFAALAVAGAAQQTNFQGNVVIGSSNNSPVVTFVTVAPATGSIVVGSPCPGTGCLQYTATAVFSNGHSRDVTNQCGWTSSDPTKATINSQGLATAVAAGSPNIYCIFQGVKSNTAVLTVTAAPTFQITTLTLQNCTQGTPCPQSIHNINGVPTCNWTITAGSLPPGITLSPTSNPCDPATLSGTPTTPGNYTFTVHGVDNSGAPASQPYAITVIANTGCTGGPPHYRCSSTGTAAVGTLNPAASYVFQNSDAVNTTRFDTLLNPSGTDCYTLIVDEHTIGGELQAWTYNGGSGTEQTSVISGGKMFMNVVSTNSKLLQLDTTGNCIQVSWPPVGSAATETTHGNLFWSPVTFARAYEQSNQTILSQIDICQTAAHPANCGPHPTSYVSTQLFDYSRCPTSPGVGLSPVSSTGWTGTDSIIGTSLSWSQYGEKAGQNTAHRSYFFDPVTGMCAAINLSSSGGNLQILGYDWCNPDGNGHGTDHANCIGAPVFFTVNTSFLYVPSNSNGIHGLNSSPSGLLASAGFTLDQQPSAVDYLWFIGNSTHVGTTVLLADSGQYHVGHGKIGENSDVYLNNPQVNLDAYAPNNTYPAGNVTQIQNLGNAIHSCEQHTSWENSNADDTWDVVDDLSICDRTGFGVSLTAPYWNEFDAIDPTTPGAPIVRLGNTFGTGGPNSPLNSEQCSNFDCIYTQHFFDQSGNYFCFASPMLGNFGLDAQGFQRSRGFCIHAQ